jgi:serpin B
MKRAVILATFGVTLVGCGGNDNSFSNAGAGLYGTPARDARERDNLVTNATKELAKGPAGKVAEASGTFGTKMLDALDGEGNVVISPLSISSALSMTLNGAAGSTQLEMLDALGFDKLTPMQVNEASRSMRTLLGNVDPTVELRVANSIWAKEGQPFKPEFLTLNESAYGAKTTQLDFADPATPDTINRWVKEATNSKIDKIVDQIGKDSVMFLINAVYFKGQWRTPFVKSATKDGSFTTAKGDKRMVPMMSNTASFGYAEDKAWKALAMPYGNGRIEMLVVLPANGLDGMVKNFAEKGWPKGLANLTEQQVGVKFPKFRLEYSETLNDSLKALGIKKAFTDQADFSGMSLEKLLISNVKHKTFIEVDEVGTEAAAATSVEMAVTSAPIDKPKEFVADKPFLFVIREKQTGVVLFTGAIRSVGEAQKP